MLEEWSMLCKRWVRTLGIAVASMLFCLSAFAQVQQGTKSVTVNGHNGPAAIVTVNGRTYLGLESVARVGKGSLSFHDDQITLSFPSSVADPPESPSVPEPTSQSA